MCANNSFGHWLRERRKALDLTQAELANQVNCSIMTIRKLERNERRASKQFATRLAAVLAISAEEYAEFMAFARSSKTDLPSLPVSTPLEKSNQNGPFYPTRFIGRVDELTQIKTYLENPNCRLLTLVGPGGIGKTRLALQAMNQMPAKFIQGSYFISLAPINSPDLIAPTIAETLKMPTSGSNDLKSQIIHYLQPRHLLLVFDNFEHVLGGAELLAELLANAPNLKLVVTSRQRLNLQAEWVLQIQGLSIPTQYHDEEIDSFSAIQLFVDHARRIDANFSLIGNEVAVIDICRVVDGMPLGIELAATWVPVLSCQDIAREIVRGLDILDTSVNKMPSRHSKIRAVWNQSWRMLAKQEQVILSQLSVFRGGGTREAVQIVVGATLPMLATLVDKSLLRFDAFRKRYSMLEVLRQYAEEQLSMLPDNWSETHRLHGVYYAAFLAEKWKQIKGANQHQALQEIEVEINNIRAAWNWAVREGALLQIEQAVESMWFFYDIRGWFSEGEQMLASAAAMPAMNEAGSALLKAKVQAHQGNFYLALGQLEVAQQLLDDNLAVLEQNDAPTEKSFVLESLARIAMVLGNLDKCKRLLEQSVAICRNVADDWQIANSSYWFGLTALFQRDFDEAAKCFRECLWHSQKSGNILGIARGLNTLGFAAYNRKSYIEGKGFLLEGLAVARSAALYFETMHAFLGLGATLFATHDYQAMMGYLKEGLTMTLNVSLPQVAIVIDALTIIATLQYDQGETDQALELFGALLHQFGDSSDWRTSMAPDFLAKLKLELPLDAMTAALEKAQVGNLKKIIEKRVNNWSQLVDKVELITNVGSAQQLPNALTAREQQILKLMEIGLANRQIAEKLVLAPSTVKWYVSQILSKLGVNNRTQAIVRARLLGILN